MTTKFILDACCGPRLFWFNKHHPNTIYIDKRIEEKGFIDNRPNREVKPDMVMDFTDLKFPDKTFRLVVWDPPHIPALNMGSRLTKTYGILNKETWPFELKKGFKECWRVLDDYGILIFKWCEESIPLKKVLNLFSEKPLFGHGTGSKAKTRWLCFMKIPKVKVKPL